MTILVVDDEALLVKGIRFNLQNEGYEVITGSNGQEAVDLAKAEQPDNDMRKHRLSPAELREAQPHESTINVKKELPAPTHISRRNLQPARSVKK